MAFKFVRNIMCYLGFCQCKVESDDIGIWGECVHCHKKFGYVTRAEMQRFMES